MVKTLKTIKNEEEVYLVTNLIKTLERLKEDSWDEALELGYCPTKQIFTPTVTWDKINENGDKILLKFSLEISEYIEE